MYDHNNVLDILSENIHQIQNRYSNIKTSLQKIKESSKKTKYFWAGDAAKSHENFLADICYDIEDIYKEINNNEDHLNRLTEKMKSLRP